MSFNRIKINLGSFLSGLHFKNSKKEIENSLRFCEISEEKIPSYQPSQLEGLSKIIDYEAWNLLTIILNTNLLWVSLLEEVNMTTANKEILLDLLFQSGKTTGFLLCERAHWWNTLTTEELGITLLGLDKNPLPEVINQYILSFIAVDEVNKKSLEPFIPILKNNINKNFNKELQRWLPLYVQDLISLCVYYYRVNFKFDAGREYSKEQIKILKENLKIEFRRLNYCQFLNTKFKNILIHQFTDAGQKQVIFNRAEVLLLLKKAQEIYVSPIRLTQHGMFAKRTLESISTRTMEDIPSGVLTIVPN